MRSLKAKHGAENAVEGPGMFDLSGSTLLASLVWGSVGSVMFTFGWKQKSYLPLWCGMAMVAVSYFVDSAVWMSVASVGILVFMYWRKQQGY